MRKPIIFVLALIGSLIFAHYVLTYTLRHRTEVAGMKAWLRSCQGIRVQDINKVILLDSRMAVLTVEKDRADVERLLRTLRQMVVVERERPILGSVGEIAIVRKGRGGAFTFSGDFDPRHAPVVTASVRSHDLGRVVQDIMARKGREVRWPANNRDDPR